MAYKKLNVGYSREFLNMPFKTSTSSNISYKIKIQSYQEELVKENLYDHSTIDFTISDCSRTISLDFDIDSKEDMRNSLYKLDTIINVCKKMKEDSKLARKEILKGNKRREELEQEKKQKMARQQNKENTLILYPLVITVKI